MTDSTEPLAPLQPQSEEEHSPAKFSSHPDINGDVTAESEEDALPSGTTLQSGALLLQHVLSQSHFGITYRGEDTHLQRPVAIKEFFPDGCMRHQREVHPHGTLSASTFQLARDRFLDEARVLARFRHPNIVNVYSFFEENNTAYMVMEYIEGETLLEVVNRRGRLSENEALEYILQVGEALEEVHRAHLLHCDVKPDNIILCTNQLAASRTEWNRAVLVDFGLTTRLEEQSNYLTRPLSQTGHFGTPGYAPLEQYTQHVDFGMYTDVYALGATLYHLLTGQTPTASADRAYGVELAPPHEVQIDVSQAVSECVMWAMQLRAEQRPQNMHIWLERLRASRTRITLTEATAVDTPRSTPGAVSTQFTSASSTGTLPTPTNHEPDERGCLEAGFAGCLAIWAIALVFYLLWFSIYAVLLGPR